MIGVIKFLKNNYTQSLIWNYISLFFLAIGGIVFSFLIGYYYDADTLGNFNFIYALYIVFSQIGVWGSQMAVTRYISEHDEDRETVNVILSCALLIVLVVSIVLGIFMLIVYNIAVKIQVEYFNVDIMISLFIAVVFFSFNKVILGYLNGLMKMKEYAVFQSLRNIFIAGWIIIFALLKMPGERISFCFACAEILVFLLQIPVIIKNKFKFHVTYEWIAKIIIFGTRILPANIVLELSTKVDILCLSFVLGDKSVVGVYSFAALFAEGFYQLFVVLRRSINPYITKKFFQKELSEYYNGILRKIRIFGYLLGVLSAFLIVVVYRISCILMKDESFFAGMPSLIIIVSAIVCNMKSIICGNILSQTGYPAQESINNVITVVFNIIFNIIFITNLGMVGAALATGVSYFIFSLNQRIFIKNKLNL